jgi:prepilin-type N-terminal cleavage/methylation domain-containing protein
MFSKFHNRRGFTLIELMIVVVIIGILAALAIPRFMAATSKAKQSEAKGILKQAYTMQRTYFQQHGLYLPAAGNGDANWATLGVEIPATAVYTYTCVVAGATFTAQAQGDIDDDATVDTWTIDETGFLDNPTNDATS